MMQPLKDTCGRIFLTVFITLLNLGFSQADFSGYLESDAEWIKSHNTRYLGYNKFRLDIEGPVSGSATVYSSVTATQFTGKTDWLIEDFVTAPDLDGIPFEFKDTLGLDFLYAVVKFHKADITFGKQPIAMGSGYTWNPGDIFNRKDMLDPTYELTGVNALRVQFPLRSSEADIIVKPEDDGRHSSLYAGLNTQLGSVDLNLAGYHRFLELSPAAISGRGIVVNFSGELMGIGIRGELNHFQHEDGDYGGLSWLTGFDYTFRTSTFVMLEIYHNQFGSDWNDATGYSADPVLNYISGEVPTLAQDYWFGLLQHPIGELSSFSLWSIYNQNDNSFLFSPQLNLDLLENTEINISVYHFSGETGTEFSAQDYGARIRARLYF